MDISIDIKPLKLNIIAAHKSPITISPYTNSIQSLTLNIIPVPIPVYVERSHKLDSSLLDENIPSDPWLSFIISYEKLR